MRGYHSIEALRDAASRRLPRFVFDFLDGGAGREFTLEDNVAALARLRLMPRMLQGVERASLETTLFGHNYAAPLGIAPMGLINMAWPGAELGLARHAALANIPFVLSNAASITVEQAVAVAPDHTWFQLYLGNLGRDPALTTLLVDQVKAAGVRVLVLTVDRPIMGRRTRDLSNGLTMPFKIDARTLASLMGHPRWSLATLAAGAPRLAYPAVVGPPPAAPVPGYRLDWSYLRVLRAQWTGSLVVKGLLHPDDAIQAVDLGADGVVVSNHGGAHLESGPASIDCLSRIRRAVGKATTILFDGGVRSGEDVAKALALGADGVLLGRAFAYGLAALGSSDGPGRAYEIIYDSLSRALPLLGCEGPKSLSVGHLGHPAGELA